jgi:hypothetical protein
VLIAAGLGFPMAALGDVNFLRGDADQDGVLTGSDILMVGQFLYSSDHVECLDAGDANDDGVVNITDPSFLSNYVYMGGAQPPAPFPGVGPDPTTDGIGCQFYDATSNPYFVTPKLVITDKDGVLTNAGLTFEAVMNKIVTTAGTGQSALALYQQWWRDLGPPSCPSTINGFPNSCGRPEAQLGNTNPFQNPSSNPDSYLPVAVFNRFDTAPSNYSTCGSYRIVFAKRSGKQFDVFNRNFIIFEAEMPNPTSYSYPGYPPGPGQLSGCMPLLQAWNELEGMSLAQQSVRLYQMFLVGYGGMPPIIHVNHLGGYYGQIRTNTFMDPEDNLGWILREFRVEKTCPYGGSCDLRVVRQVPVTGTPHRGFFLSRYYPVQPFYNAFLDVITTDKLAASSFTYLNLGPTFESGPYNAPESRIVQTLSDFDYLTNPTYRLAVEAEAVPFGLTDENILDRATSLTCAGCHGTEVLSPNADLGGGVHRPRSHGFTHVTEWGVLSHALRTVFLPARRARWNQIFGG